MPQTREEKPLTICLRLRDQLIQDGIYGALDDLTWRISPEPFWLEHREHSFLRDLGNHLLKFYSSLNHLYFESVKGRQPPWISRYLDQGKPETVVEYSRMNRFKQHLPRILRPDLILTDKGFIATELDSIPGGIGLTANLSDRYTGLGYQVIGGQDGIVQGFRKMIQDVSGLTIPPGLAIIVSDESRTYRPEMHWLGRQLNEMNFPTAVLEPNEIIFNEIGLRAPLDGKEIPVHVVYRFFELFDLKNISRMELLSYSVKKKKAAITPPLKAHLEEKMAFALFHHPALEPFWIASLGTETFPILRNLFPPTWILDPRPLPPHAVIPGLRIHGRPLLDWMELAEGTQRERQFVIKPSGFSELAWGSRGVVVGHDLPQSEWGASLDRALKNFYRVPHVIQSFYKGRKFSVPYHDISEPEMKIMPGRVRLSPYYFVSEGNAELGGALATICSLDKKLLHGMKDAIMIPCAIRN